MDDIRIILFGTEEYLKTLRLREEILRAPLGLKLTPQELEKDIHDLHLGAFRSDRLLACLILSRLEPARMKMRQVAVAVASQGKGIGRLLVAECERVSWERGANEIELSARESATAFYQKLGYSVEGGVFSTLGLPHVRMVKKLGT